MTTIINASTSAGLISTADTSGILQLQTANTAALTIDASQIVSTTNGATIQGLTVGRGAGAVASNTAAGSGALATNSSGDQNTALGYQALNLNSTGGNSTGIGYLALSASTAGSNSALGARSLQQNTSGASNSSFGAVALYSNLTGSYNSAFGADALRNNTASSNTGVGYQAGLADTSGQLNTFVGYQAGKANQTGSAIVCIGGSAGNLVTAGNNVFVGYNAGGAATSGSGNTFVGIKNDGSGCGQAVTTGGNNVIIGGYDGNSGGLDIRTASNYIVLSDGAGNPRAYYHPTYTIWYLGNQTAGVYWPQTGSVSGNNCVSLNNGVGNVGVTGNDTTLGSWNRNNGAGDFHRFYLSGTQIGSISGSGSTTTYSTSSDYRLKDNVAPMTGALDKLAQLKPVTYKWKSDGSDGQGFIAHELAEVFPDAVVGAKDAINEDNSIHPQGIDTSFLVATLTAAIQELKAEIDTLKGTP